MSKSMTPAARKIQLLLRIKQQRSTLSSCQRSFLEKTASVDRGWNQLYSLRALFGIGAGFVLFKTVRSNPRKLFLWSRRVVGIWSATRFVGKAIARK